MEVQLRTYLVKNDSEEILFRIEMTNVSCKSWINFNCNIEIDFTQNREVENKVIMIRSDTTTPEEKAKFLEEILSKITVVDAVKSSVDENEDSILYIPDKIHNYLIHILIQDNLHPYLPFTRHQNYMYFRQFQKKVEPYVHLLGDLDRSEFESILAGCTRLEEEYINLYSEAATFHATALVHAGVCYQFYIMKTDEIVFWFFNIIE